MKKAVTALLMSTAVLWGCSKEPEVIVAPDLGKAVVHQYHRLVHTGYENAYQTAVVLQQAIDVLLANPSQETLDAAREAWITARKPYSETEAFRFYEGPIDAVGDDGEELGPEGRLNAWPLNEAYIDYVEGNPTAGIVNNVDWVLSIDNLAADNQAHDEADVTTGYHAIEFLLWGQDLSEEGPGNRPYTDYVDDSVPNKRRRSYLQQVTALLVQDLKQLATAWAPGEENYGSEFLAVDNKEALSRMLNGLATLSGFELAAERLGTALDSGDQEDEQSCFSDTTHFDFIHNQLGIESVLFGRIGDNTGPSLYDLLKTVDEKLAAALAAHVRSTTELTRALPVPFDQQVLAQPEDSEGRVLAEKLVLAWQQQGELFVKAGTALGLDVEVATE